MSHSYFLGTNLTLPPVEPLPLAERIKIAKKRGDDVLIACLDEGYGAAAIREMWVPDMAREIRQLEVKAKNGDEEARKTLRTLLLMHMPAELVGPQGFVQGIMEANERDRICNCGAQDRAEHRPHTDDCSVYNGE